MNQGNGFMIRLLYNLTLLKDTLRNLEMMSLGLMNFTTIENVKGILLII
ncbi:Uncharacterised protein [Streptococcus equi subsp. zooepidemicus]|uniref:Transposase n=1 Tax=Streptococcus equi subsp. zooepidemicus TaxID=40041 RepID=A0AAX2LIL7_STRSZ|nr:hypothetical protein HIEAAJJG_01886 [Streptococcus equi subsp. zooepidemicus]SQE96758.1 Uncharacterised protein [Streptococcus equi subsp. zooepidemicus]SUO81447.1 Uncharacterised protein [Streptococcus equi subsp. zooepidemicus]